MKAWQRRGLWLLMALALGLVLLFGAAVALVLQLLKPSPGEWRQPVSLGPWSREVSVPALIRMGSHPLAAPLLDGRVLQTAAGRWQLRRHSHHIEAVCAPCEIHLGALGPAPLQLARARVLVRPVGGGQFRGTLWLGEGSHEVSLAWRAKLAGGGAELTLNMPSTPMSQLVQVFAHGLPEARHVQVTGTLALALSARWPEGSWTASPQLSPLTVAGMGSERLLALQLPAACRTAVAEGTPITGWLPRALVAAEDARFDEHAGFDLSGMLAAWQHNQTAGANLRGGSTLTQQLAKLAFTGDDRSATRKLRELLYAVEMERTLGKARIAQLYLALSPWGDGVCGAERAAQVYLGKPASKLGPVSAAWLVSLLRNPDAQLRELGQHGQIDRERLRQILNGMRGMTSTQRALSVSQLEEWTPQMGLPREP